MWRLFWRLCFQVIRVNEGYHQQIVHKLTSMALWMLSSSSVSLLYWESTRDVLSKNVQLEDGAVDVHWDACSNWYNFKMPLSWKLSSWYPLKPLFSWVSMILICLLHHILFFQINYSSPFIKRNNERRRVQESEYFSSYYGKHRIGAVDMFNYSKFQSVANEKQILILKKHINSSLMHRWIQDHKYIQQLLTLMQI